MWDLKASKFSVWLVMNSLAIAGARFSSPSSPFPLEDAWGDFVSSNALAMPDIKAMSPPILGCRYSEAMGVPKSIERTEEGTLKLTRPGSLTGLMTMILPPRLRRRIREERRRG